MSNENVSNRNSSNLYKKEGKNTIKYNKRKVDFYFSKAFIQIERDD
jgi:hypothetical protein